MEDSIENLRNYLLPVLPFRSVIVEDSQGSWVVDQNGRKYLDLNSGQFCSIFGHSDPQLRELTAQIAGKSQNSDTATISSPVLRALEAFSKSAPEMGQAKGILLSTGGEANEFALRYAKHLREKDGVLSFDRGYHGLSLGTAGYSMSRDRVRPKLEKSFHVECPLSFSREPGSNYEQAVEQLEYTIKNHSQEIAAFIVEPIISGGGLLFPPAEYFLKARELCDANDIFLIFDECQTGMARTGTFWNYQKLGVSPDVLVTSKGFGAGYPIAGVLIRDEFVPREGFILKHFSSHQNEPFSGFIVEHVFNRLEREDFRSKIRNLEGILREVLERLSFSWPTLVNRVRGEGLMYGFDLVSDAHSPVTKVVDIGKDLTLAGELEGLFLQLCNFDRTIRILPNYLASEDELIEFGRRLDRAFRRIQDS